MPLGLYLQTAVMVTKGTKCSLPFRHTYLHFMALEITHPNDFTAKDVSQVYAFKL
jgi:hypothetical protein